MNRDQTMQHIFDTVVPLLIQQGKCSVQMDSDFDDPICMYRASDGSKCAIGWLIADDRYSQEFESHGVVDVMERLDWIPNSELDLTEFNKDPIFLEFLHKLQYCHDCFRVMSSENFVQEFKRSCIEVLSDYVSTAALRD